MVPGFKTGLSSRWVLYLRMDFLPDTFYRRMDGASEPDGIWAVVETFLLR